MGFLDDLKAAGTKALETAKLEAEKALEVVTEAEIKNPASSTAIKDSTLPVKIEDNPPAKEEVKDSFFQRAAKKIKDSIPSEIKLYLDQASLLSYAKKYLDVAKVSQTQKVRTVKE